MILFTGMIDLHDFSIRTYFDPEGNQFMSFHFVDQAGNSCELRTRISRTSMLFDKERSDDAITKGAAEAAPIMLKDQAD